jgi:hypothetical protein
VEFSSLAAMRDAVLFTARDLLMGDITSNAHL